MMNIAQIQKQKCLKHPQSNVSLINLSDQTQFPTLSCPNCLDQQNYQIKKLYISIARFLQIQKAYKEINNTDVQKQLWQLDYVQERVNQLFQNAKKQIVKKSHNKQLAQKYKIELQQQQTMQKQYKKQIQQFNNQYLDIERWIKNKKKADQIDNLVRQKYFKQNNGIIELNKLLEQVLQSFKWRMERNKSIDTQIKMFRQQNNQFIFGQYTDNQQRRIKYYEQRYIKQNNSRFQDSMIENDERHWFDATFLKRYFKQASIYARRINIINCQHISQQISQIIEQNFKYEWNTLSQISFLNKFTDQDLSAIFKIVNIQKMQRLQFYQPRKLQQMAERMIVAEYQVQQNHIIPEMQIMKGINFTIFQSNKFNNLQNLIIDRIQMPVAIIQKTLNACPNIRQLMLIKNNLQIEFYQILGMMVKDKKLPNLLFLTINQNSMGFQQTKNLFADKDAWANIQHLNLFRNKIDDSCLQIILLSNTQNLHTLILNQNYIKTPKILLNAPLLNLKILALDKNQIQTLFALNLVSRKWTKDTQIYFNKNRIRLQTLAKVAKYKNNIKVIFQQSKKLAENYAQTFISQKVIKLKDQNQISFVIQKGQLFQNQYLKNTKNVFQNLDLLYEENAHLTARLCQYLLSSSPSIEQKEQSQQIQQELKQRAVQQENALSIILLGYSQIFRNQQNKKQLTFIRQSSVKSQVCVKILTTQFLCEYVKFQQIIKQNQWNYQQISADEEQVCKFKQFYIQKISKQYDIQEQTIAIHKISKFNQNFKVQWSTNMQNNVLKINQNKIKLKVNKFFNHLILALQDFNLMELNQFGEQGKVQSLAKWPYFVPVKCKRYGLNVSKKFDNENDDWYQSQNKQIEWPIGYHGVTTIGANQNSIQQFQIVGLIDNQIIKGGRQNYLTKESVNIPNENIGSGFYIYPHIQTVIMGLKGNGVKIQQNCYYILVQSKINPKKIKVCSDNLYWLVNQPKDIRPYALLVLKKQVAQNYPTVAQMYGDKQFKWEIYKDRINA